MRKLTLKEELSILEKVKKNEKGFIGAGSSRAVYSLNSTSVLKVAIDREGRTQNKREIQCFYEYGGHFLAKIFAYGTSVVLMEKVDPLELEDDEDVDFLVEEGIINEEQADACNELYEFLSQMNGYTIDNLQYGLNKDGWPLAYDYGYECGKEDNVSHNLRDFFDGYSDYLPVESILKRLTKIQKFLGF